MGRQHREIIQQGMIGQRLYLVNRHRRRTIWSRMLVRPSSKKAWGKSVMLVGQDGQQEQVSWTMLHRWQRQGLARIE